MRNRALVQIRCKVSLADQWLAAANVAAVSNASASSSVRAGAEPSRIVSTADPSGTPFRSIQAIVTECPGRARMRFYPSLA